MIEAEFFRTLFSFQKFKMSQENQKKTYETVLFLGKPIFSNGIDLLLKVVSEKVIRTKKVIKLFTPNPEQLVLSRENKEFSSFLDQADILIPDGTGVVAFSQLAGRLLKQPSISERIAGVDLVQHLLKLASDNGWKVLLVGGKAYTGKLHNIFVSGLAKKTTFSLLWDPGYKNIRKPTKLEEDHLVKLVKKEQPDIVFVAFGAPWQEQWIIEHEALLTDNKVKLAMVVGGSFDMLFGKLKRAPLWVRAVGLEWLFRLVQEPSRWLRQFKLLKFIKIATVDLVRKITKK